MGIVGTVTKSIVTQRDLTTKDIQLELKVNNGLTENLDIDLRDVDAISEQGRSYPVELDDGQTNWSRSYAPNIESGILGTIFM